MQQSTIPTNSGDVNIVQRSLEKVEFSARRGLQVEFQEVGGEERSLMQVLNNILYKIEMMKYKNK